VTASRLLAGVIEKVLSHNAGKPHEMLQEQFALQSSDSNLYYRGVAYMFWHDALRGGWGNFDLQAVIQRKVHIDGSPLARTATWTWISGDQHLSNFGAWKNRVAAPDVHAVRVHASLLTR
jgi:uncharacterized protein (DUF2252 family)